MSLNFPSTPATNDLYTLDTRTWRFNGVGWEVVPPELESGVPAGGTTGQVLAKVDDTDYNTTWIDAPTGGGGGGGIPEISGSTTVNELSSNTYTITNYDANAAYIITISDGSYTRDGATISWTFPSVTTDTVYYLTALTVSNGVISTLQTFNVTVQNVTVADTAIIVGDFSAATSQGWY